MQTVSAQLKYLRGSHRKVRLFASVIKGLSANEAEAQLLISASRSRDALIRLLRSAVANATHNAKLDPKTLFVKEVRVDGGPMQKRWTPRARGSASKIEKKTSHVTIVLGVRESKPMKYTIVPAKKTEAKEAKKKTTEDAKVKHAHEEKAGAEKPKEKRSGAGPKMFQRKSI